MLNKSNIDANAPNSRFYVLTALFSTWSVNSWEGSVEMNKRDVPVKLWANMGSD